MMPRPQNTRTYKRQRSPSAEAQSDNGLIADTPPAAPSKKRPKQESTTGVGNYGAQARTGTASSSTTRDENLDDLSSKPTHRTFRICLIPCSVTERHFREWLESLVLDGSSDSDSREKYSNVLELSLSLYTTTTWQVATATFRYTPRVFAGSGSGRSTGVRAKFGDIEAEIVIDCNFLGITPLFTSSEPSVDVVAVPGLGSHAFGSWKSPNGYRMWLRDFLPKDVQGLRIHIFGYDSALKDSTSTCSIQQYSRQLLDAVNTIRSGMKEKKHQPLIFIGHSLGGLVIKQALADAKHGSEQDHTILNSCSALFFFGVPNKGLNNDNLMSLVKGQNNAYLVNDLREGSALLQLAYREFLQNVGFGYCRVVSFYETKDSRVIEISPTGKWEKTGRYVRLVTQESATWAIPSEALHDQVPIDADHSAMVKFTDRADRNYLSAVQRLKECVEHAADIVGQRLEGLPEVQRTEILEWISTIPYSNHHTRISEGRLTGTCEWIFTKPEYHRWQESTESKLLLLRGIPGAGKTYVASKVIDTLLKGIRQDRTVNRVAYFYCNRAEENRRDPESILNALVQQLVQTKWGILRFVIDLYMDRKQMGQKDSKLTLQEGQNLLTRITNIYPRTTLCLDALDEVRSDIRINLLKSLRSVIENSRNLVKIFATSRNDPDIQRQFSTFPRIDVQPDDSFQDIHKFIHTKMETVVADGCLLLGNISDKLKSEICNILSARSRGMFQLAALHIDFLCQMDTAADVEGSLMDLPDTLTKAYDDIYKRILDQKGRSAQLAINAIRWIKFSYEPLASKTLLDAATVCLQGAEINIDTLLKISQNFLILDEQLDVFRFAHLSVEEYLDTKFTDNDCQFHILEDCLSLLCCPEPHYPDKYDLKIRAQEGQYRNRHILLYATVFWPWHFSRCEVVSGAGSKSLIDLWNVFTTKPNYKRWLIYLTSAVKITPRRSDAFWDKINVFKGQVSDNALFAACIFGFCRTFPALYESRPQSVCLNSLLLHASCFGYLQLVQYLLDKGAMPVAARDKRTPLHLALAGKHEEVARLLIINGADVSTLWSGKMPLHIAVENGCDKVVRMLLEKGADVSTAWRGKRPLHIAMENRNMTIIRLLLENGASACTTDNYGLMALDLAFRNRDEELTRLLIEKGASNSATDREGQTMLHLAIKNGNDKIIRLLIEKDASNSAADKYRQTPLHLAFKNGNEELIRLLIEKGASNSAADKDGQTPLHLAFKNGNEDLIRLLIDKGASVSGADHDGKTPLHLAFKNGNEDLILLLIEKGASNFVANKYGWTPLHQASNNGCKVVAQLLIDKGASISAVDMYRQTPLHRASDNGHEVVARLLIDKGASISAADMYGWTPLHRASDNGHEAVARLLIEKGASISVVDKYGWTPMHRAYNNGHEVVARLLIEKGAYISAKKASG